MRTGKRWLAGIAAGGLAAGLISFTGGGVATAAAPTVFKPVTNTPGNVQVIRDDDITYKSVINDPTGTQAGITATATANGTDTVEVTYKATPSSGAIVISGGNVVTPQFIDLTGNNNVVLTVSGTGSNIASLPGLFQVESAANPSVLTLNIGRSAEPGLYTLTIFNGTTDGAISSSLWVSGSPSRSVWTPDARNVVPGATAQFAVSVVDAGARPTYLLGAERLTLSSSNAGKVPVTTPAAGFLGSGAGGATSGNINAQNAATIWAATAAAGPFNVTSTTDPTTARGEYLLTATPNSTLVAEGLTTATNALVNVGRPTVATVAWPPASRAQQNQTLVATGVFPANSTPAVWSYQICAVPATVPNTFDPGDAVALAAGGTSLTLNLQSDFATDPTTDTVPGTYALSVYYRADGAAPCGPDGRPVNNDSVALTPAQLITFGGPIAALAQTPATAAIGVNNTQTMTVTATDAAGRRTLPTPVEEGDSISYASANLGVVTLNQAGPSAANLNAGVLTYVATGVAAGTTTVSARSVNASVAAATSTIGVQQSGGFTAASTVALDQANVIETTDPASLTNRSFNANMSVNTLVFKASGLIPGQSYSWNIAGPQCAPPTCPTSASPTNGIVTADASGNASATVTVSGLGSEFAELDFYTFTLTSGTGATRVATVTYVKGYPVFASPTNNGIFFAAAGSSVSVPVVTSDQYGNPISGATVTIANAAGAQVAQGTTNASGAVTLSVTAPATGTAAFSMTGLTPNSTNALFAPLTPITVGGPGTSATLAFTVDTRTPVLTSIGASPSTVFVPVLDSIVNDGAEATTVTMRVNTPDGFPAAGVTVSFTGSEGVKLSSTSPNALAAGGVPVRWNGGATTATANTNSAGIATVYAWTTKTGTNTVTGTVGGQTATASFTARNDAFSGRTIEVKAPEAITTSEIGVVTLTVKDAFGNVVPAATPVTVQFNDGSIGTFADGTRQKTVQPDGAGQVQVTVVAGEAGDLKFKSGVFTNSSSVLDQFGAAANQLFRNSPANSAPGFPASNAPLETTIKVTVAKGLLITNSGRDSRGGYFSGVASGFAAGETVNVRFKVYNKSTKKWSTWKAGGTVTLSTVVDSAGNRSFSGIIEKGNALKVRVVKSGVNSEIVTIPAK